VKRQIFVAQRFRGHPTRVMCEGVKRAARRCDVVCADKIKGTEFEANVEEKIRALDV
jgi:hypothetical protein